MNKKLDNLYLEIIPVKEKAPEPEKENTPPPEKDTGSNSFGYSTKEPKSGRGGMPTMFYIYLGIVIILGILFVIFVIK